MQSSSLLLTICCAVVWCLAINNFPDRFKEVTLKPSAGWRKFTFGNAGDFCYERFHVHCHEEGMLLRLTDAFCTGDEFMVYDWGKKIGTVRQPYDGYNDEQDEPRKLCKHPLKCPDEAWKSSRFASHQFYLSPGPHRITVKSMTAPIGAGDAFIKVMPVPTCCGDRPQPAPQCHQCQQNECKQPDVCSCGRKFHLIEIATPHCSAARACLSVGMKLAPVTKDTFDEAAQLIFSTLGPNSKAWVASYNGDTYGNSCLAFTVGAYWPSGNINLADCSTAIGILCQRA